LLRGMKRRPAASAQLSTVVTDGVKKTLKFTAV